MKALTSAALGLLLCVPAAARPTEPEPWATELRRIAQQVKQNDTVAKQPATPPAQKRQAQAQVQAGLAQMTKLADEKKDDPGLQYAAARAFLSADRAPAAFERADAAVALAPQDADARALRASTNYELHRFPEAAADAREALRLDPQNEEARAVLKLSEGRSVRPVSGLSNVGGVGTTRYADPAATPRPVAAKAPVAPAAPVLKAPARDPIAEAAAAENRKKGEEAFTEANARVSLGDHPGALTWIDRGLSVAPADPRLHALKARALIGLKDSTGFPAAVSEARQAAILAPKSGHARLLVAETLEAAGAPRDEVLKEYAAAAELEPTLDGRYRQALARRDAQAHAPQAAPVQTPWYHALPEPLRRDWHWLAMGGILLATLWIVTLKRRLP